MRALSNIVLLTIGTINFFLSFFVYLRNKKNNINRYFAITIFSISVWCIGIALFRESTASSIIFWGQSVYFAFVFVVTFFLYFTFVFPSGDFPKNKLLRFILIAPPIVVGIISIIPRTIISEAVFENGEIILKLGWGFYFHSALILIFFIWAFTNLIIKYKKSFGKEKQQLIYLFLGTGISTIIGITTNIVLFFYTTAFNWVGPVGTIIMVVFISYAITRYKLMDIRLIVARTIAFGSIVTLLVVLFAVLSAFIAVFFSRIIGANLNEITTNIIVGIILSLFIVTTYQPLRKFVENTTNKFLFKKSYDPEKLLSDISDAAAGIIDLQILLKTLSKILNAAFKFEKIGFAFITSEGNLKITYKQGFKPGVAEKLVSYPGVTTFFVKQLEETPGLLVIDEMMTRYKNGDFKPVDPALLKVVHEHNIAVVVPLYSKDILIGLIVLGAKKSGDQYSAQDITTLDIIAGQAAVAIENARLYDELKYFNIKLEEEVKAKTAELSKANVQLKRLDQAKSDFISIASHQLRTPLTVIKGYISMIQEGSFGVVPKKIDDNLAKVFLSNERLIALVENLLDISRIESGRQKFEWTVVDFVELAQRLTENLANNAEAQGLKMTFHKPKEKIPHITAEYNKLHDVMINFIDNAIKYTPKGKIDVTVEEKPKGMITFCVKDTGRGIDPEVLTNLFQKFSRGKGSFQVNTGGSGLGLYVARMVIEAHEGKVWAESEGRDKGATFCFSIPIAGPKERKDLPYARPGQKVDKPIKSSARGVSTLPDKPKAKKKKK